MKTIDSDKLPVLVSRKDATLFADMARAYIVGAEHAPLNQKQKRFIERLRKALERLEEELS